MNIYIGNLPKDFDENELLEMFEEYGVVNKAVIIRDRYSKISQGYGFVEMDDKKAALKAIEDWNHGSIDDNIIKVKESKSQGKNQTKGKSN
jgi:RNA recognition motif-containing protein